MGRIHRLRHCSACFLAFFLLWPCIASGAESLEPPASIDPAETDAKRGEAAVRVSVFYLTNRRRYEGKPVADSYSGERGEAHFGRCEVEFTPIPVINRIAPKVLFT